MLRKTKFSKIAPLSLNPVTAFFIPISPEYIFFGDLSLSFNFPHLSTPYMRYVSLKYSKYRLAVSTKIKKLSNNGFVLNIMKRDDIFVDNVIY